MARKRNEWQRNVDRINRQLRNLFNEGLNASQLLIQTKRLAKMAGMEGAIHINKDGLPQFSEAMKYEAKLKPYIEVKGKGKSKQNIGTFTKYKSYKKEVARETQKAFEKRHIEFMKEYAITDEQARLFYDITKTSSYQKIVTKKELTSNQIMTAITGKDKGDIDKVIAELRKYTNKENKDLYDPELAELVEKWYNLNPKTNITGTLTGK